VIPVERLNADRIVGADLVFCAAPGVFEELRLRLEEADARVIDLSGALELDPDVPLYLPGKRAGGALRRLVAVPRGIVAGLGMALGPLVDEAELRRVTAVTLEAASGAGRRGVGELSDQTLQLLNAMTGEAGESEVFPQALAFDCLPIVGDLLPDGDTGEERRLAHVLRRLIAQPSLPVEVTRVRVPVFGGSLACVHAELGREISEGRLRELWAKGSGLELVEEESLPTPRTCVGQDDVAIGRLQVRSGERPGIAFVVAVDNLRRGAALTAVEAATVLLAS
jgi:aspartate-semialdehyde dehydrogenase